MLKFLFYFFLLLLSSNVSAQLQSGDRVIGFGNNSSLLWSQLNGGFSNEFGQINVGIDDTEGIALVSPNFSVMASDVLQMGVSALFLSASGDTGYGLSPFFRLYLSEPVGSRFFLGAGLQYFYTPGAFRKKSLTTFSPSLGLSLAASRNLRVTPELTYLIGEQIKNQFILGLGIEYMLDDRGDSNEEIIPDFRAGTLMLGVSATSFTFGKDVENQFYFRPEAHVFVATYSAIGARANISSVGNGRFNFSQNSYGLSIRQFLPSGKALNAFLHLGADVNTGSNRSGSFTTINAGIGALMFLRERIALEGGIGYVNATNADGGGTIGLSFGGRFFTGSGR